MLYQKSWKNPQAFLQASGLPAVKVSLALVCGSKATTRVQAVFYASVPLVPLGVGWGSASLIMVRSFRHRLPYCSVPALTALTFFSFVVPLVEFPGL